MLFQYVTNVRFLISYFFFFFESLDISIQTHHISRVATGKLVALVLNSISVVGERQIHLECGYNLKKKIRKEVGYRQRILFDAGQ